MGDDGNIYKDAQQDCQVLRMDDKSVAFKRKFSTCDPQDFDFHVTIEKFENKVVYGVNVFSAYVRLNSLQHHASTERNFSPIIDIVRSTTSI